MSLLDTPTPQSNRQNVVVALKFWTDYEAKPNGEVAAVDWVTWGRRGDLNYTTVDEKVSRLMKPFAQMEGGQPMPNPVWEGIRAAYTAWKEGQELPESGTPLEAWPAVGAAQIKVFREAGCKSVEDVAAIQERELMSGKVRLPNARQLVEMAQAYISAKAGQAQLESYLSERDAKLAAAVSDNEALKAQLAEMAEALKQMQAQGDAPRRGRPPKDREPVDMEGWKAT
jgi:hypothetical protein